MNHLRNSYCQAVHGAWGQFPWDDLNVIGDGGAHSDFVEHGDRRRGYGPIKARSAFTTVRVVNIQNYGTAEHWQLVLSNC